MTQRSVHVPQSVPPLAAGRAPASTFEVRLRLDGVELQGTYGVPPDTTASVLFAHGSGSSRNSPRNRAVARRLNDAGFATLLFDLLTFEEESVDRIGARLRFDVQRLGRRLAGATAWLCDYATETTRQLGYFGASTGAAAALIAAAQLDGAIGAVVSRGGRPDLAGPVLHRVRAPTLLLVGSADPAVIDLNRKARLELRVESALECIPGAGHLFEEPGALEAVADAACAWFLRHLSGPLR